MTGADPGTVVRTATPADELDVRRLLDSAVLEYDALGERIATEDVLVATEGESHVRGVIVLDPDGVTDSYDAAEINDSTTAVFTEDSSTGSHVTAIAVARRHRDRGIGTALIEEALEREGRLTATFDDAVWPFYERLGFDRRRLDEDRFVGVRSR